MVMLNEPHRTNLTDVKEMLSEEWQRAKRLPLIHGIPLLETMAKELLAASVRWCDSYASLKILLDEAFPPPMTPPADSELLALVRESEEGMIYLANARTKTLALMHELQGPRETCELL